MADICCSCFREFCMFIDFETWAVVSIYVVIYLPFMICHNFFCSFDNVGGI